MRGDYYEQIMSRSIEKGSPPHAWGLLGDHLLKICLHGITPTCVGTTRAYIGTPGQMRDHPHMRGDYTKIPYYPDVETMI